MTVKFPTPLIFLVRRVKKKRPLVQYRFGIAMIRAEADPNQTIEHYKARIREHFRNRVNKNDLLMLEGAFLDIEQAYRGYRRHSGLPVVMHSLRVGILLCMIGADIHTTIAGLLHDIIEDTNITKTDIRRAYGPWFSSMSEALKKTNDSQNTHKKLLHAGRQDIRTLQIKFCDRLDNMRELKWLPGHKRRRISKETLSFYLPMSAGISVPADMREEFRYLSLLLS